MMALYQDVGSFSRDVIARIEDMIAEREPVAIEPRARPKSVSSTLTM